MSFVAILLLAAHLICVNVGAAGPLVCVFLEWFEGRGNVLAGQVGRRLASWSLHLLFIGIAIGTLLGWLMWDATFQQVVNNLHSKVMAGIGELAFSVVFMAIHLVWWKKVTSPSRQHRLGRMLFPLLAGTNSLYHFSVLFVLISNLVAAGNVPEEELSGAAFRALAFEGEVVARALHFLIAALAATGVAVMLISLRETRAVEGRAVCNAMTAWGGKIALLATLTQIPVGLWVTLTLDRPVMLQLMGGDVLATAAFVLSLLMAFYLMHKLAKTALGKATPPDVVRAIVLMSLVIVLMTAVLKRSQTTVPRKTLSQRQVVKPIVTVVSERKNNHDN